VDVSDTEAAYVILLGWLTSQEGGLRWVKNLGVFLVTVLTFWLLGGAYSAKLSSALSDSARVRPFYCGISLCGPYAAAP
jgi:hypothetical protein